MSICAVKGNVTYFVLSYRRLTTRFHSQVIISKVPARQTLVAPVCGWAIRHAPIVTTATQITLLRILMIPVFVGFAVYYARSIRDGEPDERMRIAAVTVFAIAALSDMLDGWVARRFNQFSRLGAILDPLADKLLLLAAVLTLAFSEWPARLPLWFVIVVISREILTIAGAFLIDHVAGKVEVHPHWTGKVATFILITTAGCAMMRWDQLVPWVAAVACAFTFVSGGIHLADAMRQMQNHDQNTGSR